MIVKKIIIANAKTQFQGLAILSFRYFLFHSSLNFIHLFNVKSDMNDKHKALIKVPIEFKIKYGIAIRNPSIV